MNLLTLFPLSVLRRFNAALVGAMLVLNLVCVGTAQAQAPQPSPALITNPALSATSFVPPAGDVQAPGNPYGLKSVWLQGDAVARITILLLAIMSLLSWYIIIAKLLEQRRLEAQAETAADILASSESLQKRIDALPLSSPFRFVVVSAVAAARRHDSVSGQVDLNDWLGQDIVRSVTSLHMRSQQGLSALATVGSTAPFVGLFGTVWGIYNALVTIGASGQASIDKVAGPVGEALIMTALGIAVAVPAVLGYNWLVRRSRVAQHTARGFGSELHTQLLVEMERNRRNKPTAAKSF